MCPSRYVFLRYALWHNGFGQNTGHCGRKRAILLPCGPAAKTVVNPVSADVEVVRRVRGETRLGAERAIHRLIGHT